ncbi:MAG: LPS-assembly protein LptD, partial [Gammaproteobacteria bacterium]
RVNWQDPRLRTLNLAWRYEDPAIDQLELSGLLPVSDSWNLVGRWLHDVHNRRSLETLGGVEYESCCWRARVFVRRTVDLDATTGMLASDDSVVFEIELKGLGSLGDKISTELANDIPGYETRQRTLR